MPLVIENANDSIAIDKSLFSRENNQQIWVVGLINNRTRVVRMEIVNSRINNAIKKIIKFFVPKGNIIVSDGEACYNWIDDPIHNYVHHVQNHGHADFGFSIDFTSHIEQFRKKV